MVSLPTGRASPIPTYRIASIAAGVLAFLVAGVYFGLTWDAHLTNFQVRWMCDEDRPYILRRARTRTPLALPEEVLRADPRVSQLYAEAFPRSAGRAAQGRAAATRSWRRGRRRSAPTGATRW
jgi:hypothetical protein